MSDFKYPVKINSNETQLCCLPIPTLILLNVFGMIHFAWDISWISFIEDKFVRFPIDFKCLKFNLRVYFVSSMYTGCSNLILRNSFSSIIFLRYCSRVHYDVTWYYSLINSVHIPRTGFSLCWWSISSFAHYIYVIAGGGAQRWFTHHKLCVVGVLASDRRLQQQ